MLNRIISEQDKNKKYFEGNKDLQKSARDINTEKSNKKIEEELGDNKHAQNQHKRIKYTSNLLLIRLEQVKCEKERMESGIR